MAYNTIWGNGFVRQLELPTSWVDCKRAGADVGYNVVANTSPELHPNLLHKNLRTLESQYYITISYGLFA